MWTEEAICIWRDGTHAESQPTSTPLLQPRPASRPPKRKRELSEQSSNMQTPQKTARTGMAWPSSEDENLTPRPGQILSSLVDLQQLSVVTSTTATGAAKRDDSTHPSSVSSSQSSTHTTDSRGAKRKRTLNPTKHIEERRYAKYPIQHSSVTNADIVHVQIRDVVKRVKRIGRAKGVLSPSNANLAQTLSAGDEDLAKDILDAGEDTYGTAPEITRMQRIVDRAMRNTAAGASEAASNSGVHDFLLEEAHVGSSVGGHLVWENITTASIIHDLVPEKADVERADSKKVDFCIALDLHNYDQLGQRLYQGGVRHLNQTNYGPVRYNPIALSIETKLPGESGTTALLQLSTWASSQIRQLRNIIRWVGIDGNPTIPPLPLLLIQGHAWFLYYLEHDHERDGATLWSCGLIGTTETLLGAYQVTAALQVLMYWAVKVYQPWLEESILRPRDLCPGERLRKFEGS